MLGSHRFKKNQRRIYLQPFFYQYNSLGLLQQAIEAKIEYKAVSVFFKALNYRIDKNFPKHNKLNLMVQKEEYLKINEKFFFLMDNKEQNKINKWLYLCCKKLHIYIIQLYIMNKKQALNNSRSKRSYSRICLKKRKLLVKMVNQQGLSISYSIKKLKIKLTTARLILKKYKQTGTFPMRKFKKVGKMYIDLPTNIKQQDDDVVLVKQQNTGQPFLKQQFEYSQKEVLNSFTVQERFSRSSYMLQK